MKKLLLLFILIISFGCESNKEETEPPCVEDYECATVIEKSGYSRRKNGPNWEYSFRYRIKFNCNDYIVDYLEAGVWYTSAQAGVQPGERICNENLEYYYPPSDD